VRFQLVTLGYITLFFAITFIMSIINTYLNPNITRIYNDENGIHLLTGRSSSSDPEVFISFMGIHLLVKGSTPSARLIKVSLMLLMFIWLGAFLLPFRAIHKAYKGIYYVYPFTFSPRRKLKHGTTSIPGPQS
jgi:hypothetical protein